MADRLYEVRLTRQAGESGALFLVTAGSEGDAVEKARAELAVDMVPERAVLYSGYEVAIVGE